MSGPSVRTRRVNRIIEAFQTDAFLHQGAHAEALYKEGKLSVNEVARNLGISKGTLYSYLRYRGVKTGSFRKQG